MTYQNGISTNANDLLDKFRLFAISEGWTVNRWAQVGQGYELCIEKGYAFFNFRSWLFEDIEINSSNEWNACGITLIGSDGFNAALTYDQQPGFAANVNGSPYISYFPLTTNSGTISGYHFFSTEKCLYVEAEVTTGSFLRFGCGTLDTIGSYTSNMGAFFFAPAVHPVRTDWLDAPENGYFALNFAPFVDNGSQHRAASKIRVISSEFDGWVYRNPEGLTYIAFAHERVLQILGANPLNAVGVFTPVTVSFVNSNLAYPIGYLPSIRFIEITNYVPGQEFSLGLDVWKVFPWYMKNGLSGTNGIAYLKV